MSDVNLTDTERERDALVWTFYREPGPQDETVSLAEVAADTVLASEWLRDHDRRVRAAALAPIFALADEWGHYASALPSATDRDFYTYHVGELRTALAAAGVDAAPTPIDRFDLRDVDGESPQPGVRRIEAGWHDGETLHTYTGWARIDGDGNAWPIRDAVLAAALDEGVDAAPNETTTEALAKAWDEGWNASEATGFAVNPYRHPDHPHAYPRREYRRAAVPSGHEQEGDHRG